MTMPPMDVCAQHNTRAIDPHISLGLSLGERRQATCSPFFQVSIGRASYSARVSSRAVTLCGLPASDITKWQVAFE